MKVSFANFAMLSAAFVLACGNDGPGAPSLGPDPELTEPGSSETPTDPEDPNAELPLPEPDPFLAEYAEVQAEAAQMSVEEFLERYPAPEMVASLSYDAMESIFLDEITAQIGIDPTQQNVLASQGFVALSHAEVDTFEEGYHQLYFGDLPVLITSDSILYALHRSFDAILMDLELVVLEPELRLMLSESHARLGEMMNSGELPPSLLPVANDVDVYLTVARQLLSETAVSPVGGVGNLDQVQRILDGVAALNVGTLQLFGTTTNYDYSQMKPRGHYEDDPVLSRYFQAMIWLGRTDLSMVLYPPGQAAEFNRTAVEGAVLLNTLMQDSESFERWARIDDVIGRIIGERDSMSPADVPQFLADTGIGNLDDLAAAEDQALMDALIVGNYGLQRIMSQIMFTNPMDPPLRLPRVYQMLGQRFTIDSYVFNNVTFDRVLDLRTESKLTRMLPDELDVQFVLGSNMAAQHLAPQLQDYPYQGVLHELRFLADSHPEEFWEANLYNMWLSGIRALSDTEERPRYPEAMRTAGWQDKTLNTRAASRAELRHDTLLYVKQSYSGGIGCEYPDAYVEPVPAFYDRMAQLGAHMRTLMQELEGIGYASPDAAAYFDHWESTMQTLHGIALKELDQEMLTGEEIAFLGATIEQEIVGCGEIAYDGWYAQLLYDPDTVAQFKPTIADVHTAPTDEQGNERGWIQHMATGHPVLMVLTVPQCDGSRAYVGPISSYYDVLTEDYDRWSNSDWRSHLDGAGAPPRPAWTESFLP